MLMHSYWIFDTSTMKRTNQNLANLDWIMVFKIQSQFKVQNKIYKLN